MTSTCPICGRSTATPEAFYDPNKPRHGWGVCAPAEMRPVTAAEVRTILSEEVERIRDLIKRGAFP